MSQTINTGTPKTIGFPIDNPDVWLIIGSLY